MPRLAACALVLALVPVSLAGCGNERSGSTSLFDAPADRGSQRLRYPSAGLELVLPNTWFVARARSPQVFRASFEDAFVSAFAYRRDEQLPTTDDLLRAARDRLVRAAQRRDRSFRLDSARLTRAAGAPAIELLGRQTISMGRLRLRSLHVYKRDAEYVIELGAPTAEFGRLDRATFPGIRRTLKVTGVVKPQPKKKRKNKGEAGGP